MKQYRLRVLASLAIVMCLSTGFVGCGKNSAPSSTTSSAAQGEYAMAPILSAWQQGDQSDAVRAFSETDWTARPLFEPGSVLVLSEQEYAALPASRRASEDGSMVATMRTFKEIATAVAEAGRDAVAQGDTAQARKYFDSLKECGTALSAPDRLSWIRVHGNGLLKMVDKELERLPQ